LLLADRDIRGSVTVRLSRQDIAQTRQQVAHLVKRANRVTRALRQVDGVTAVELSVQESIQLLKADANQLREAFRRTNPSGIA